MEAEIIYLLVNMWIMLIYSNYLNFTTKLNKLLAFTPWLLSIALLMAGVFI